jgi:hypothetical protein
MTTDVVLTNCTLFTGTGEDVIGDGAVWVSGPHIRRVGPAEVMSDVPLNPV